MFLNGADLGMENYTIKLGSELRIYNNIIYIFYRNKQFIYYQSQIMGSTHHGVGMKSFDQI